MRCLRCLSLGFDVALLFLHVRTPALPGGRGGPLPVKVDSLAKQISEISDDISNLRGKIASVLSSKM